MPVGILRVVHRDLHPVPAFVGVFFHGEAVILVQDRLAEFAAVRLGDFDFPGIHREWGKGIAPGRNYFSCARTWPPLRFALFSLSIWAANSAGLSQQLLNTSP